MAVLMLAIVAVKVMVASPVPVPTLKARPSVLARVSVPLVAVRVTWSETASRSLTAMALPPAVEKTSGVFSLVACGPGTVLAGSSFTAVTSIVIVFGVGSRFTPPLAVPPVSWTWKVKLA